MEHPTLCPMCGKAVGYVHQGCEWWAERDGEAFNANPTAEGAYKVDSYYGECECGARVDIEVMRG